jgi:hypothetical protein
LLTPFGVIKGGSHENVIGFWRSDIAAADVRCIR